MSESEYDYGNVIPLPGIRSLPWASRAASSARSVPGPDTSPPSSVRSAPRVPRWEPQSVVELETMYPYWHAWLGVNGVWYVRRLMASPEILFRGKDLPELTDQIAAWVWEHS